MRLIAINPLFQSDVDHVIDLYVAYDLIAPDHSNQVRYVSKEVSDKLESEFKTVLDNLPTDEHIQVKEWMFTYDFRNHARGVR